MATGDLIKLGTLYLGGAKRSRPTNPSGSGDVHTFSAGQTIEIRNTETNDADKIQWREVNDSGKKYFISDRVLIRSVSWDDLNVQSLILGKEITIDGQLYKIRSLTGGSNYRNGSDPYSGGSPANNEWDRWIINEANLVGLPKPSAQDLTNNGSNQFGAHNQYWNWFTMYSMAQETQSGGTLYRVVRGNLSAQLWSNTLPATRSPGIGWRPVLEVSHTPPEIQVNVNGMQRKVESVHVKVSGAWREVAEAHVNINGIWRKS